MLGGCKEAEVSSKLEPRYDISVETVAFERCDFDAAREATPKELEPQVLSGFGCANGQCQIFGSSKDLHEAYYYPLLDGETCKLREFTEFTPTTYYVANIQFDNSTFRAMGLPRDTMRDVEQDDVNFEIGDGAGYASDYETHNFMTRYGEIVAEDTLYIMGKPLKILYQSD